MNEKQYENPVEGYPAPGGEEGDGGVDDGGLRDRLGLGLLRLAVHLPDHLILVMMMVMMMVIIMIITSSMSMIWSSVSSSISWESTLDFKITCQKYRKYKTTKYKTHYTKYKIKNKK